MSRRARRVKPRPALCGRPYQQRMQDDLAHVGELLLQARADRRWASEGFETWRAYCVFRVGERCPPAWGFTEAQVAGLVDVALELAEG